MIYLDFSEEKEMDSTKPIFAVLMVLLSMERLWLFAHSSLPLYEICLKKTYEHTAVMKIYR